ncbi:MULTISPECIES: SDR family oxidoreductase [unclassified Variovorax]|uniref:SDR family oxidoreductase n=1 Tax=unclassified Variovorax TaxID=663243 RepID=UPI001BD41D90|nr:MULTISPECIES: SDR family NAD(P)-dependent oxidoreductase [unclassified Variovorax]
MSESLHGKVAWITGAATGIGFATAKALADGGAKVVISGNQADALEAAARALRNDGAMCDSVLLDVADAAAVAAAGKAILGRHGAVDILVNCAGLNVPRRFLHELDVADWQRMLDVNLSGALYCAQAVLPAMRRQRDGLIVNIASWGGKHVVRAAGAAYTAAKHAVVALTEAINVEECVNGIRACTICPAEVSTPFLDQRPRPPTDEERQSFLLPEDLGRVIRMVAELPARACVNEIVISPTRNPLYLAQHPQPVPAEALRP